MGPLAKTGRATITEAGHRQCGSEGFYKRGKQSNNKDKTAVVEIDQVCTRKAGHLGYHRCNGDFQWK